MKFTARFPEKNYKLFLIRSIYFLSDESCVQLRIDIQYDSDSTIPQQNLKTAIKFGVEKVDALDKNKYVVAFLRKLLF